MKPALFSLCVLSVFICGCNNSTTFVPPVEEFGKIKNPRERWEAYELSSYSIEIEKSCFCGGPLQYRTYVRGDSVDRVVDLETGEEEARNEIHSTIDELFDLIDELKANDPVQLDLEYHSQYGYPTLINHDQSHHIADEELFMKLSSLKAIR